MIGENLQGNKQGCHHTSCQPLLPIYQHHAGNSRRNIGQSHQLPDMTGSNDNEKIRRKGPQYSSQRSQPDFKVEGPQQDIKSEQHDKDIPHIRRQKQMIHLLDKAKGIGRIIAGSHLIGRHSSENTVCPAGALTCFLQILLHFASRTDTGHSIVLSQNSAFGYSREKVKKGYNRKKQNHNQIGK